MAININEFTATPDSGANTGSEGPQGIWMDRVSISVDGVAQPYLHVESFTCEEAMSKLYRMEVEFTYYQSLEYAGQPLMYQPDSFLGRRLALRITRLEMERYFCGIVTHFAGERPMGAFPNQPYYRIRLTVMPRVWLLTQNVRSRAMPEDSSPWDLIRYAFSDSGNSDYDVNPVNYDTRFRVQYEESDFNFLSRTFEEMGIFYFFDQPDAEGERMIFGEAVTAYRTRDSSAYANAVMNSPWEDRQELCPSRHGSVGYDFVAVAKGDASVSTTHYSQSRWPEQRRYERIPYRASAYDTCDRQARLRMESSEWGTVLYTGEGNTFQLMPGFFLPCAGLGTDVVMVSVSHEYSDRFGYRNHFTCMPRDTVFRPARTTPRPTIAGTQTAVVVYVEDPDNLNRVGIKFFWDASYGTSSGWARTSHPWAGRDHGAFFSPQVDDEVVVSFQDGDPAQPIIVGRVYNGIALDPWGNPKICGWSTVSGAQIKFDDSSSDGIIVISQPSGNEVEIRNFGSIKITHQSGSVIDMDMTGAVRISGASRIQMEAPIVGVSAGMVTIDAGMVNCSGAVKCDTLISNTVISASYTPGAGNIW